MNENRADWTFSGLDVAEATFSKKHGLMFQKQAIYVGDHPYEQAENGVFSVSEDLIDNWVSTGRQMLKDGVKIPLPKKHSEDSEDNRGWITGFKKGKDDQGRVSLYLKGEVRDEETKATLRANDISIYSPVSAKVGGKTYYRPIRHACITSYPIIKGLENFKLVCAYDGATERPDLNQDEYNQYNFKYDPDCPACQHNKREMERSGMNENMGRPVRRLFAFSGERLDAEIDKLAKETGERVLMAKQDRNTLLMSESARQDDDHIIAVFSRN